MITASAGQWLLTAVFAAAAVAAALSRRDAAGAARPADAAFCGAMCVALIVMTWDAEPAAAMWVQVVAFGCAALWFATNRPGRSAVLHVLMAGAMIWMLTVLPAVSDMSRDHDGMGMAPAAAPTPVLAGDLVLAACCLAVCLPWLTRAVGSGLRLADPFSAGQAAMSAGMAAMLLAAL